MSLEIYVKLLHEINVALRFRVALGFLGIPALRYNSLKI